jgi:hypothetical protein
MRLSAALTIALVNLSIAAIGFLLLTFRIVREPWDLCVVVVITLVCPIGGLWFTVSSIKRDRNRGISKWQTAVGVLLALGMFAYGLLLLSIRD